ncbi:YdcF family protein [Formicincola oecophyllae]|uniref:YdcF family protein n=1 Tax=Formicincola oecophyllae TaxID=2558361 RepID=A0A4Y6U6U2_9PROT|nr:YdcF family protein [Formicincola oecophyllae]QDH13089.1 YdcF family protein [Formicincola oecophyllae]
MNAPLAFLKRLAHGALKTLLAAWAALLVLGAAGFVLFVWQAVQQPATAWPPDGALVVLTGGKGRIHAAMDLASQHPERPWLISGVGPGATLDSLERMAHQSLPEQARSRLTLGRQADSTYSNAGETARWAVENHVDHVVLVTAGYHMARACLELNRAAPDLLVTPWPVQPEQFYSHASTTRKMRLMATEYIKYLAALIRPWTQSWAPVPTRMPETLRMLLGH